MEGRNQTPIVELILVGFGNDPELQPLLFLLFLVIYIAAVAGNLLIIVLVVADRHLHTPMYYFVANLSAVEICYVSTTLPRLIGSLATGDRTISLHNCFVQFDFYGILSTAETLLLSTMCCDRYLAICHPLRYPALMNGRVCGHMVAGCWIFSISYTVMLQTFILQFTYCGPKEFDHFFCDFASDVYYVSGFTIYALSQFQLPTILYKIFSVMSTVLIPLINPLIYCLRNKEVHQALRKAGMNLVDFRHRQGV
ncbi:olfactory receptor 7A17-like [Pelodiscus sinensis]|uniref:olfactory receptor 7A17-like n=1 Tax=Pelodiscus sinensis TaxID=13735 RepID=UPI003F6A7A8E